jgi:hypothetical protein
MKKFYTLWASAFILLLSGCGARPFVQTDAATIIMKTPKIKFADTGYIRSNEDLVALELFSAGQAVGKFEIENMVCVEGEGCMRKSSFNAEYLSAKYPDTLMENILRSKPIYDRQNLVENEHGFTQIIIDEYVDIKYKVTDRQIYFKDRENRVLIKIKKQ